MIGEGFELGEPYDDTVVPDDEETWHVHDPAIGGWGTGIKCTACAKPKPVHGGGKKVYFSGLHRLKQHREAGTSAIGMEKDIIDSARADGRLDKIDRAR